MKKVSPDQWIKIEALMDKALEMPIEKREEFVRSEGGSDEAIVDHVLKLLAASDHAGTFLESSSQSHLHDALAKMASVVKKDETENDEGRMVGPYRLVRKIGRGGMGQVYLAVRDDEAFKRYVALKVIRKGMDSEDILKRFKVERHILASLTHPNIARLLDGGFTEDGQSYFVMEYVDGEPIDKFCNEHRLSVEERLKLFEKVASAVHYAHQNLVVHRDLKPGNILVTTDGSVKLLDFGIAKFLNPDLSGYTLPMTRTEIRVMTPEYASPEQVRGNSVTTASDVYQLGILLYELLTGHRPFTFETKARGEIEKIILEVPPEKPSTMISKIETLQKTTLNPETVSHQRRTPFERLRKQLSGDLDHIVLMALRKETDRRYQSADQLLKDLENYRAGRPVMAQADTFQYRATRFIQRNQRMVLIGVFALLALITISIQSVRYAVDTSHQRDLIALEAKKAEQVRDFLLELFEQANPEFNRGVDPTAYDLLKRGAENIMERLANQPAVQSEMLYTIGLVYADLGYYQEARPLMERSLQIEEELAGNGLTPGLAQSLYGMGYLEDELDEQNSAIALLQRSFDMRMALFGQKDIRTAESLNDLTAAMYSSGEYPNDTLLTLWNQVLDTRMELLEADHKDIIETLTNVATVYLDIDNLDLAESSYKQALEMTERSLSKSHPFYASIVYNYGTLLYDKGRYQESEELLQEALEARRRLFGDENDGVANAMNWLGRAQLKQGKFVEAESNLLASKEMHQRIFGANGYKVARDLNTLGGLYEAVGRMDEARTAYADAVSIARISAPPFDYYAFVMHQNLARLQMQAKNFRSASTLLRGIIEANLPDWGDGDTDIAAARLALAECLIELGSKPEAMLLLEKVKAVFEATPDAFADQLKRVEGLLSRAF